MFGVYSGQDLLDTRKGVFNKGKGINEGLAILAKGGWVVHLDADMWLPPQTRLLLQQAKLDKSMVYGIDRSAMCAASISGWHSLKTLSYSMSVMPMFI